MQSSKEAKNPNGECLTPGKYPLSNAITGNKRDSGYGTDVQSPASQSSGMSVPRQFIFGSYGTEGDMCETLEEMDINDDEDVFDKLEEEEIEVSGQKVDDDNDKEVEELFGDNSEIDHSVSEPIAIQRPKAPIPTPEGHEEAGNVRNWTPVDKADGTNVSEPLYVTSWTRKDRQKRRFRPIASRNFGTQTPSPRGQEYGHLGTASNVKERSLRLRLRCESESSGVEDYPHQLPDLVPQPRDRSVSLPNVYIQEREVGRELRRISDEFNSSFTPITRREVIPEHPSSFPRQVNIDIQAYWSRLRRIVSTSSFDQGQEESPSFNGSSIN